MAELVKTVVGYNDVGTALTYTAATAGGDYIDFSAYNGYPDQRVMIAIRNLDTSHDATITFKAGDGMLSAQGDIPVVVAGSATSVVKVIPLTKLDTARVKNTSGTNKGKIMVTSTIASGGTLSNVQIAVICVK